MGSTVEKPRCPPFSPVSLTDSKHACPHCSTPRPARQARHPGGIRQSRPLGGVLQWLHMPRKEWLYQLPFEFPTPGHTPQPEGELPRFVREVAEPVYVRAPLDAAQHLITRVFVPFEAFDQEELFVLLLSTKNRITHEALVYRGTIDAVQIRLAELFKPAIQVNAPNIILSHNHPSGVPEPSLQDRKVTQGAIQAAQLLGIALLDHIVVGAEGAWVSLKEQGMEF
jgi:DNA repair protein RadC